MRRKQLDHANMWKWKVDTMIKGMNNILHLIDGPECMVFKVGAHAQEK